MPQRIQNVFILLLIFFRSLQAAILTLNAEDKEKCRNVFFKLGSGIHPTVEEIVALIPLFQGEPFHIRKIGSKHVVRLLFTNE